MPGVPLNLYTHSLLEEGVGGRERDRVRKQEREIPNIIV
jgi:hypothetical protein